MTAQLDKWGDQAVENVRGREKPPLSFFHPTFCDRPVASYLCADRFGRNILFTYPLNSLACYIPSSGRFLSLSSPLKCEVQPLIMKWCHGSTTESV